MKKSLNNKGFTLVELLAVLVILIAIMGIAIPTISSSLERTKAKQNESRYKIIETAAEQYVTDNKNKVYGNLDINKKCYFNVSDITNLTNSEMEDADGNDLSGYFVLFESPNNYKFTKKFAEVGTNKKCTD